MSWTRYVQGVLVTADELQRAHAWAVSCGLAHYVDGKIALAPFFAMDTGGDALGFAEESWILTVRNIARHREGEEWIEKRKRRHVFSKPIKKRIYPPGYWKQKSAEAAGRRIEREAAELEKLDELQRKALGSWLDRADRILIYRLTHNGCAPGEEHVFAGGPIEWDDYEDGGGRAAQWPWSCPYPEKEVA